MRALSPTPFPYWRQKGKRGSQNGDKALIAMSTSKRIAYLGSWYRKAADHSPSYLGGVWEAEVQLSYMYRDGRLPEDNVQAYMWFAIVGGDGDIKQVARHMTKGQGQLEYSELKTRTPV